MNNFDQISNIQLYILLGTPRSGINLLSRLFQFLHFHCLNQDDQLNATLINSLLFQALEHSDVTAGMLPFGWMDSVHAERASRRILSLLSKVKDNPTPIFLADSGFCHTLPLWLYVINQLGIQADFIQIIRHPHEVALSLQTYQDIDIQQGHLVWLSYIWDTFYHIPVQRFIFFDGLLADPITALSNVLPYIDFKQHLYDLGLTNSLIELIDPALKKHNVSDLNDKDKQIFVPFAKLFQQIKTSCHVPFQEKRLSGQSQPDLSKKTNLGFVQSSGTDYASEMVSHLLQALGENERQKHQVSDLTNKALASSKPIYATVYVSNQDDLVEKQHHPMVADQWQKLKVNIAGRTQKDSQNISLSPLNVSGMILISSIRIVDNSTDKIVWFVKDFQNTQSIQIEGPALSWQNSDGMELLVSGVDAEIVLCDLNDLPNCPMRLEIWIKPSIKQDFNKISDKFNNLNKTIEEKNAIISGLEAYQSLMAKGLAMYKCKDKQND